MNSRLDYTCVFNVDLNIAKFIARAHSLRLQEQLPFDYTLDVTFGLFLPEREPSNFVFLYKKKRLNICIVIYKEQNLHLVNY